MAILVLDPVFEERIKADRGDNDRDEVWDGVLVMAPLANIEHQDIGTQMCHILLSVLKPKRAGRVFQGINVSDRDESWTENYRIPDVAVYLTGNPAIMREAQSVGGPDLAVEIVSQYDRARDKADFYAKVGVREFLVIDREPWALELYRPDGATMGLVARTTPGEAEPIRLTVLPLAFRLLAGPDGPVIEAEHPDGRRWAID